MHTRTYTLKYTRIYTHTYILKHTNTHLYFIYIHTCYSYHENNIQCNMTFDTKIEFCKHCLVSSYQKSRNVLF